MARILIVDDKAPNREYLLTLLGYGGNEVLEASSGPEALSLVHKAKPDLIIVDIVMPAMDGYEFVRLVRTEPENAEIPVIFYTASYLEKEARQLADMCNVRFIITKPAEPQEILEKVKAALEDHQPHPMPPSDKEFDRAHLLTLSNKLADKIQELEALNAGLEERVRNRTGELVAANSRLQDLNRLKDEFIMIVSHDLRSPVGGIQMIVEVLREEGENMTAESRARFLDAMSVAAARLIELVNNLVDLVKIEAGKARLDLTEFQLSDVVRESLKSVSIPATAKHIALKLEVAPGEPVVSMDRVKLSQVFNTIFINSIRQTSKNGEVLIAIRSVDEEIQVSLTDPGYDEKAKRIGELQPEGAASKGRFAVGLGLAIVQAFVELHGGRIDETNGGALAVCLPLHK